MAVDNESTSVDADDFDLTEALSAEFDKAESGDVAADVPAAEPEETASEKADRVRDEKGRFAAKTTEEETTAKPPELIPPTGTIKNEVAPQQPNLIAPVEATRAPPGWSPTAKAAFGELPADHPIRQAVAQRETEIDKGFAKLAEYKPIERFAEMAKQSGTTLDRALENYVSIENELRRDFLGGVTQLCQRQGIDPVQLANTILARNGGPPSNGGTGETQGYQPPSVDLAPLTQKISALESYIQQQQNTTVQSEIDRFASDAKNVFFDNVKSEMGRLIQSGLATDLTEAYDRACWANPEIRTLLIKQQSAPSDASAKAAAATQARNASKSITGSPVPGASGRGPETSIEDEIRELMNAAV